MRRHGRCRARRRSGPGDRARAADDQRAPAPRCSITTRRSARPTATARSSAAIRTARAACASSSGLGPADCFYGHAAAAAGLPEPVQHRAVPVVRQLQRLGLCGDASDVDAGARRSAHADAGSTSTRRAPTPATTPPRCPSCVDPSNGRAQVVYITGSSNFPPLLAKLAPLILATGYTPVYQVTSSCNGVSSVFGSGATR